MTATMQTKLALTTARKVGVPVARVAATMYRRFQISRNIRHHRTLQSRVLVATQQPLPLL